MSSTTIEWTDRTWNPVTGCEKVSPGCKYCYAERLFPRIYKDRKFGEIECHSDRLEEPLHWTTPRRVFVNSMSDLFHELVPEAFIWKVFAIMAMTPRHTYQILTKRPRRMLKLCSDRYLPGAVNDQAVTCFRRYGVAKEWPLPNVHLGVSVEDPERMRERFEPLLKTPAAVRFISYEPALAFVDFHLYSRWLEQGGIGWIIIGGESGHHARPFELTWARKLINQCQLARCPVFVKQLGRRPVDYYFAGAEWPKLPKYSNDREYGFEFHLKDSHGGDWREWPTDLRVRQFPGDLTFVRQQ